MSGWLEARRVLVVRLDNIGDVIMAGPALRAVHETTGAEITLLASRAGATAVPLLPWVSDVIVWRALWQEVDPAHHHAPQQDRELISQLAARNFDAAIIMTSFSQSPHAPAYLCYLAGIPLRAGQTKEFGGQVLTFELRGLPEVHQVERNLRLVEALGFEVSDRQLAVMLDNAARHEADCLLTLCGLRPHDPYILLHPGASAEARRYPPSRYAEAARRLDLPVVVTGTERERDLLEEVAGGIPQAVCITESSLPGYAALIERAALVVCNNTLPVHLADALHTPVVVLFSGTDEEHLWSPRHTRAEILRRPTGCTPCYRFSCPIGLPCLDVSPFEVAQAAERLLAGAEVGS